MNNDTTNRAQSEPAPRFANGSRPTCRVETADQDAISRTETPLTSPDPISGVDPTAPSTSVSIPDQTSSIPVSSTLPAEHPASGIQNPSSTPASPNSIAGQKPAKRIRNGKIARLPHLHRDMVNRLLRNNTPYARIREALEMDEIRVTERNISNWKTRGGYRDWCAEQDRAVQTRLFQENMLEHLRKSEAGQIPEVGLQLAATHLSAFFLKPETQEQLATDPAKYRQAIDLLCRVARQVHNFQKYRDDSAKELGSKFNPERVRRERVAEVEETRGIFSSEHVGTKPEDPITPHRNFFPNDPNLSTREFLYCKKDRVPEKPVSLSSILQGKFPSK